LSVQTSISCADPTKPIFVKSLSPDGQFALTLSAGEINIQSGKDTQIIESENEGFVSERGELGKIEWKENSDFFLISTSQGAHDQYLRQNLYQLQEIVIGSHRAWAFHEVTLINLLGTFALIDPAHVDNDWIVALITFSGPMLVADLWPAGRNSHAFNFSSDHYYKVEVMPHGGDFSIIRILREPGELSKERAKVIWRAR
jgi:hypothetical protein